MDDSQLVAAAAKGDQDAFASLFVRYRQRVYRVAYRIMLNEDDALDVTQDVFVRLADRLSEYSGRGSFGAWIGAVTANVALSHLRRPHRREMPTDPDSLADVHTVAPLARHRAEQHERRELVDNAMRRLSCQQRAILLMQCGEDIGPGEVARRLGLPPTQVRVQLRRAILRLRESIFSTVEGGRES